MAATSKIEWTHATFNPWIGCAKVAAGCEHCYAEAFAKRTGKAQWGVNGTRVKTGEAYWRQPLKWNSEAAAAGERRRVFCASLADVFEDWRGPILDHHGEPLWCRADELTSEPHTLSRSGYRPATIGDVRRMLFNLIDATPHLDWLLLTKRPENVRDMLERVLILEQGGDPANARFFEMHGEDDPHTPLANHINEALAGNEPFSNVWLGTSIANQSDADRNVAPLLGCRALTPVLFVSAEPLLGQIDIRRYLTGRDDQGNSAVCGQPVRCRREPAFPSLDLVIVGGESGHHARPMHPDWARGLRDQCQAAGVPFFFKQWGEFKPVQSASFATPGGMADGTNRLAMLRDGRICFRDRGPALCKETIDPEAEADLDRESARWEREFKAGRGLPEWETSHPLGYQWMAKVGKQAAGRLLDGREWNELPLAHVPAGANHA